MMKTVSAIIEYREMLFTLVRKDLRTRYKASFLGFFWTFLNPLLMLAVYSIIFPYVMRVQEKNYAMFLFVALIPWMYFSMTLQSSTTCVLSNASLVKKIYFPRQIIPVAISISGLVNMFFGYLVVVVALLIEGIIPSLFVLYSPLLLLIVFLEVTGFTLFLSCLTVYFRDLEHITGIVLMAVFYATPTLYSVDMLPQRYRLLILLNPISPIIVAFRDVFYYGRPPDPVYLSYALLFSTALIFAGLATFDRLQRRFAEEI